MGAQLFLIAGDKAAPLSYSQATYDADNSPKELYLVKGATHVNMNDKESYLMLNIQLNEKITLSL